jgi:hypothetical protein
MLSCKFAGSFAADVLAINGCAIVKLQEICLIERYIATTNVFDVKPSKLAF